MKGWALVVAFAINAYLAGVMVVFAAVVYPAFGAVERAAFPAAYASFNARIGLPVVAFEFAAFACTLALYVVRPLSSPAWAVHVIVALGVAYFAITFAWHLPAHRPLAAGANDVTVLAPLLASQWARTVVQLARLGVLAWLGARAVV